MRSLLLAAAAVCALAAPAQASVVFSDNFDTENGGATALNYTGFANFSVTGAVDLIASGSFLNCVGGTGACVDLDGSSGPGELRSVASFSFNAGETVRLAFDLSGNQRGGAPDDYFAGFSFAGDTRILNYGFNYFGTDIIVFADVVSGGISSSTGINPDEPFAPRSIFFTAGEAGTLRFFIGTNSADNFGPALDNVSLDIAAVPEPASWAMMIAGFGLAGAALRWRDRARLASA